jgi:hypothetical protein
MYHVTRPHFLPLRLAALLAALLGVAAMAPAESPGTGVKTAQSPAIDAKVDAALRQMSSALTEGRSLSFEAHCIADEVLPDGQKVQAARNQKVLVRRPDRIHATVAGDQDDLLFVYDGKQITLFNPRTATYASTAAKSSIDDTLDMLASQYGMSIPLADLVFADPYKSLIERVRSAKDLGQGYVFDAKCRHLAFRQESVDWQIWIDTGTSLPRKLVITYKEQPGHPEFTAFFDKWNLSADAPDSSFEFKPPPEAKRAEFAEPNTPTTKQTAARAEN